MRNTEAPRLARSVSLQMAALAAAVLVYDLPRAHKPVEPQPPPKKEEVRIRVVKLEPAKPAPKPAPKPPEAKPKPEPKAPDPTPKPPEPPKAVAQPKPPAAKPPPPRPAPAPKRVAQSSVQNSVQNSGRTPQPSPPRPLIAADSTSSHGVRMRVLVPRSAQELTAHLRASGGCLVVSRMTPEGAEVIGSVTASGALSEGAACGGIPRLVRDGALNAALGDPIARARSMLPPEERSDDIAMQVLLSPRLHTESQRALHARFGDLPEEALSERAAAAGYELTCFAEPEGSLRCQ